MRLQHARSLPSLEGGHAHPEALGARRPRVVIVRPPWTPDVGELTEEERLTTAVTCAPAGDLPLRDWQRGAT